ncbi:MAG TPA: hypothetical protein VI113_08020 [Alphaproteobacteria bacterium]
MEAFLEYRNVIGYVLLVALAALIILRLQAARNRHRGSTRRMGAERLAERHSTPEMDSDAESLETPGKRMSFGEARVQFYVMALAAIVVVLVWLVHRMA